MVRTVMGFTVLLFGLILAIPGVPGPGFVFIIAGLAILATEYVWARRYLNKIKEGGEKLGMIFFRKKAKPDEK
jgi:tellurite resistance protein TerC